MIGVRKIQLTPALISMLGFSKRSGALITGYEAVRRAAQQKKLNLIILDEKLAANSYKRVVNLAGRQWLPVFVALAKDDEMALEMQTGYKIVGIQSGGLADGFIDKLKQEHQWR